MASIRKKKKKNKAMINDYLMLFNDKYSYPLKTTFPISPNFELFTLIQKDDLIQTSNNTTLFSNAIIH